MCQLDRGQVNAMGLSSDGFASRTGEKVLVRLQEQGYGIAVCCATAPISYPARTSPQLLDMKEAILETAKLNAIFDFKDPMDPSTLEVEPAAHVTVDMIETGQLLVIERGGSATVLVGGEKDELTCRLIDSCKSEGGAIDDAISIFKGQNLLK